MNVVIPAELEEFINSVVRSGSYDSEADVVAEALRLLKKREQLRRDVSAGVDQLDHGECSQYGENSLSEFLQDIRDEERKHFAKKNSGK